MLIQPASKLLKKLMLLHLHLPVQLFQGRHLLLVVLLQLHHAMCTLLLKQRAAASLQLLQLSHLDFRSCSQFWKTLLQIQ